MGGAGKEGRVGSAGRAEWGEQEEQEVRAERDEREETTKGMGSPADGGKKLRRSRPIFRKEGPKGFIERLALWSGVVNSKDQRKAISPSVNYGWSACVTC